RGISSPCHSKPPTLRRKVWSLAKRLWTVQSSFGRGVETLSRRSWHPRRSVRRTDKTDSDRTAKTLIRGSITISAPPLPQVLMIETYQEPQSTKRSAERIDY